MRHDDREQAPGAPVVSAHDQAEDGHRQQARRALIGVVQHPHQQHDTYRIRAAQPAQAALQKRQQKHFFVDPVDHRQRQQRAHRAMPFQQVPDRLRHVVRGKNTKRGVAGHDQHIQSRADQRAAPRRLRYQGPQRVAAHRQHAQRAGREDQLQPDHAP
ncbi:conserved hypothetical protein [Ricinus communis]|uniref:Uncharacterized protein n=1 Tax=Ricinus communis TaxID=3988 RepID=B9THI4_RICCO|nr:conserved hypothetical protein [Ricinus communis]